MSRGSKITRTHFALAVMLTAFRVGLAQVPASVPAGSTGICKDGTYSSAVSRDGACHGHKGIQTWYATQPVSTTPAMPVPTPASSVPAVAAPRQADSLPSFPAPTPVAIGKPDIATERAKLLARPPAPGGGPGLVWLNATSKVYHCPGTDFYGKTKSGSYVTEAEAKAKGAHPSRNKPCKESD